MYTKFTFFARVHYFVAVSEETLVDGTTLVLAEYVGLVNPEAPQHHLPGLPVKIMYTCKNE